MIVRDFHKDFPLKTDISSEHALATLEGVEKRMKNVLSIVAAILLISVAASAQVPSPFSVQVGGALSVPNSPETFSEGYKTGFHGTAGLGYKVMPNLQLVGKIEYHRFSFDYDADPTLAASDIEGGQTNMWMFGSDLRYAFGVPVAPVKPFVLGGVGFARTSISEFSGSDPLVTSMNDVDIEPQTDLYFNLGGGVEFKTGPAFSLFGQVRYVSVQTEGESAAFVPITLGLKFF